LGSEAICHFHARAIARRRKARFPLRMCRILLAAKHLSQTQLDGIAHEKTIICRQLFAGHVMGSRPMKRKKNLLRMIIALLFIQILSQFLTRLPPRGRSSKLWPISQHGFKI